MPPKWLDLLDVRLKEDTALSRLYEEKGPITQGAQAAEVMCLLELRRCVLASRSGGRDDLSLDRLSQLSILWEDQREAEELLPKSKKRI